jgi:uncharacterized membrane protein YkvA (DUF1232 family)
LLEYLKIKAGQLKREIFALHLAARDPRTPWYAKALIVCVVAYALSPIDLIPDPIPILGYVDDLLLLPLGIWLALRLIPREVLQNCRVKAASTNEKLTKNWWAAGVIVLLWLGALIVIVNALITILSSGEPPDSRLGY